LAQLVPMPRQLTEPRIAIKGRKRCRRVVIVGEKNNVEDKILVRLVRLKDSIYPTATQFSLTMPSVPSLDDYDLAILDILQRDNTTPQREIARLVHLSAPAVQRRIGRLRESGVIRKEVAVLDANALGRPLTLTVEVHVHDEHPDRTAQLRERIKLEPAVQQCYVITGEADYLLIITASTMADYEALTERLFRNDPNVRRFRTSVALGNLKMGLEVPLARS
jgi:DNA-binding Lrp family transcriptional regulator